MDRPQYIVEDGGITGAGKEFLETVLIGSVVDEKNIRGLNRDGCKSIRQKLVRAITPLIENKGMSGYSISKELNEAIDLSMQVATHKEFNDVDELVSQGKLFGKDNDPVSVEIARRLEGTQKSFAEFMQTMNGGLKYAAHGEADIFLGGVESREDILSRMLNLKKTIRRVIDFFKGLDFFKGDFVKKAVPVFNESGAVEYADRWMPEKIETFEPRTVKSLALLSDDQKKEKFEQAFYEFFKDEDGKIGLNGDTQHRIQKLDRYPEGVDMENCEFHSIGDNTVTIAAGGDWQQMINITLGIKNGKFGIVELYGGNESTKGRYLHQRIKDIEDRYGGSGDLKKSLTYSGHKLQGRMKVQGMDISIENKKGSTRSGTDKDGHDWSVGMNFDYGYIRGTVGKDKDHLDCYLGPNLDADTVYIVHQNEPVTGKYDEDKIMLGFSSEADAQEAYLKQYDRHGFLGSILEMNIEDFKELAFDVKNRGKRLEKTRERAYGMDLDYVLDFDEWLENKKLVPNESAAIQWINEWGAEIKHPDDLVNAVIRFRKETDTQKLRGKKPLTL
jgi:hypothetical protein